MASPPQLIFLTTCSNFANKNYAPFRQFNLTDVIENFLDGPEFSTIPTEKTILNRLVPKNQDSSNVYLEELQVDNITNIGCTLKAKQNSYHYKANSQIVYTYPAPYKFKINDFFPNKDAGTSTNSGSLPKVCPDTISAYDLSMNYHDIPYQGNCSTQPYHFYFDDEHFDFNPLHELYKSGMNEFKNCLSSIKVSFSGGDEIPFNVNQIDIVSVTQNDNTYDKKYKVQVKTKSDTNFYVPNTYFDFYICADVYTPLTTVDDIASTTSTSSTWTGHYYLANDITWETADAQKEISVKNLKGVFDGRYRRVKNQNFTGTDHIWDNNEYLFEGMNGWFRNLHLTLDVELHKQSSRNTVFNSTNIENVYLTEITVSSSGNDYGIGIFSTLMLYSNSSGVKLEIKRVAARATLNLKEDECTVGIFAACIQSGKGSNKISISEVNNMVEFINLPTALKTYQNRWFGYEKSEGWTTTSKANELTFNKIFDDYSNNTRKVTPKYPATLSPDRINVTRTDCVDYGLTDSTKNTPPTKNDYTIFDFNNYWYIPTTGNRAIPQRAWAVWTGNFS